MHDRLPSPPPLDSLTAPRVQVMKLVLVLLEIGLHVEVLGLDLGLQCESPGYIYMAMNAHGAGPMHCPTIDTR